MKSSKKMKASFVTDIFLHDGLFYRIVRYFLIPKCVYCKLSQDLINVGDFVCTIIHTA